MAVPTSSSSIEPKPFADQVKLMAGEVRSTAATMKAGLDGSTLLRATWMRNLERISERRDAMDTILTGGIGVAAWLADTENRPQSEIVADLNTLQTALVRLREAQKAIIDLAQPTLSASTGLFDYAQALSFPVGREADKAELGAALDDVLAAIEAG